jgi:hypothetical protein
VEQRLIIEFSRVHAMNAQAALLFRKANARMDRAPSFLDHRGYGGDNVSHNTIIGADQHVLQRSFLHSCKELYILSLNVTDKACGR